MVKYYIGADVHATKTELAFEHNQKIVKRVTVPTTIPDLRKALAEVGSVASLVIEEGPMADWLWRNLKEYVAEIVVCDPRRNRLISGDGDKDDRIDAAKLAQLQRGGYLRVVHHPESQERADLKRWVSLYHDRVQQAVREINKIRMLGRQYGLRVPGRVLTNRKQQRKWLTELDSPAMAKQFTIRMRGYEAIRLQVKAVKKELGKLAAGEPIVEMWRDVPGIGLIRAITLLAYLDTPWRFGRVSQLWKYCGIGLERCTSGTDKHGKPRPGRLQLAWRVNRRLKDAIMGAALSAIRQKDTPFAKMYDRLTGKGQTAGNARHTVARKLTGVLWGMWKTNRRYELDRV